MLRKTLVVSLTALMLAGCGDSAPNNTGNQSSGHQSAGQHAVDTAKAQAETARLNAFFEEVYQRSLTRSPMLQTYVGIKTNYDKLDDISEARQDEDLFLTKQDLERLRRDFKYDTLNAEGQLSYRIFEAMSENTIEGDRWRHYDYPVNQMFGWQSDLPAFLITMHQVGSAAEAEAYVKRLLDVKRFFGQLVDGLNVRANKGIIPPKFVFPIVIDNSTAIITGAPFDKSGTDSALFADFKGKVNALDIPDADKTKLINDAEQALQSSVKPAFDQLIATLKTIEKKATTDDGVWKFANGDAYYTYQLKDMTTTDMTAEEIHDFGLSEVARIHGEMEEIMKKVGYTGTLKEFFQYLLNDPKFMYPQTEAGKEQALSDVRGYIDAMYKKIPEAFATLPQAKVEVRAVEPFREKGTASAFYQQPSLDGSRPGYYYVNTYDMKQLPKYSNEAIAYHEAIPGHHMQIAIAQELKDVPQFRKLAGFTAYIEGWGLYAEKLAKELGGYADPYSDFGRLSTELWRAARLVVDTGIHSKRWTREQAIAYMDDNTPNPHGDNIREIERYIVMPGQATAYKIGMAKILELREKSRQTLGDKFDIKAYHDVVLKSGAVPLNILQDNVTAWTARVASGVE